MTLNREQVHSIKQLENYFSKATTPREKWRTGLECEIFAVKGDTLNSVPYTGSHGIEGILTDLIEQCNWMPVHENEKLLGLRKGSSNITLEPGGQIELSGIPQEKTQSCVDEYTKFYQDLLHVCSPKNILLLPMGYQPVSSLDSVEWLPKSRYNIMSRYFLDKGKLAHHMMKLTSSVQVNIDYEDERDFSEKFRLNSYLAPVLQSIYSNSPFKQGTYSDYLDFRGYIWEHTDNDRCGIVRESFQGDFSFMDYVKVLLDMPIILLQKEGKSIPMHGITMRQYMEIEPVYMDDFATHLSFAFFETRLKQKYIEIRVIDAQHPRLLPSIPSIIRGLFYHNATRRSLLDYFSRWSADDILDLHYNSHKTSLSTSLGQGKLLDLCQEVFQAGKAGLKGLVKEGILAEEADLENIQPVEELLMERKKCPAEVLLDLWEKKGRDLLKIKDEITIQGD
ncbi:glutamate--cysteine ligase [Desulfitibacter alkalitolerans]|uniref:glutamate--cysteine ligase n=1 Tax=Desulfitibacter alkalitolerans TaxID=264641 RepID=UPI000487C7FE|nr:glutamate-cysteine ligase family protein [Desulfitibacter alkalitolerans]